MGNYTITADITAPISFGYHAHDGYVSGESVMSNTMKKWELTRFGKQNLELVTARIPDPGPGQVLVRVQAVALNYRDKMVIENGMGMPLALPVTPASDMAGEVVAVGDGVSRFRVGDRVISTCVAGWLDGRK